MSPAPITAPARILSAALYAALAILVDTVDGIPAVYWQQAPGPGPAAALLNGTLPGAITVQAQADLLDSGWIGEAAVEAPLLIKAFATSDDAAQDLLAAAVAAVSTSLPVPPGYALSLRWVGEVPLPPSGGIHTACARYRVTLRRT